MPREKKTPKADTVAPKEDDREKNVKIQPLLHRKLKTLAAWKEVELKDLIEAQLEQFAAQEWAEFLRQTGRQK